MSMRDDIVNRTAALYQTGTYDVNAPVQVAIDPASIALISSIVLEVIKIIQGCRKTPEETVDMVQSPIAKEVNIVKTVVRRRMGFFRYWWNGGKVIKAV